MKAFTVLVLIALQPLLTYNGGPPLGSLAVGLYAVVLVFQQLTRAPVGTLQVGPHVWLSMALLTWAIAVSLVTGRSLETAYEWLTFVVVLVVGQELLRSERDHMGMVLAGRLVVIANVAAAIIQTFVSGDLFGFSVSYDHGRVAALHYNANGGALFLLMAMAVLLGAATRANRGVAIKVLDLVILAGGVWAMYRTGSRAGIAALAVVIILALVAMRSSKTNAAPLGRSFRIISALLVLFVIARYVADGDSTIVNRGGGLFAIEDRSLVWAPALSSLEAQPVFGPGPLTTLRGVDNPHNVWLGVGLELGVPGIALFFSLVVWTIVTLALKFTSHREASGSREMSAIALLIVLGVLLFTLTHSGAVSNSFMWLIVSGALYGTDSAPASQSRAEGKDSITNDRQRRW